METLTGATAGDIAAFKAYIKVDITRKTILSCSLKIFR